MSPVIENLEADDEFNDNDNEEEEKVNNQPQDMEIEDISEAVNDL